MKRLTRLAVLALVAPLLVVACSSNSSSSNTPTATPTSVSTVAGVGAPTSSTTPFLGTSTSETTQAQYTQYVSQVCSATVQFENQLNSLKSQALSNPSGSIQAVKGPVNTFAQNLKAANPPSDLKTWQSDLQQRVDAISTGLNSGDVSQVTTAFESPFPPIPTQAKSELQNAAKNNPDCQKANLFQ